MNDFEYVLTDENTIKSIVKYVNMYSRAFTDKQNIKLAYGVTDKDRKVFVAMVGYMSDCIKRCDDGYDDYSFVAVIHKIVYSVSLQSRGNNVRYMTSFTIIKKYEDLIKGAINFYLHTTYSEFESSLKEKNPDFRLRKFNKEQLAKYFGETSD